MNTNASTPLRNLFNDVFKPAKLANRNPQTVYQYDLNLQRFEDFLARPPLLSDLTDEAIATCMAWLKSKGKLSAASIGKFRDNFCYIWKYLNARRFLDTLPTIDPVPEPIRTPRAWTADELERLWQTIARLPGQVCGIPTNLFFLSLHQVLWNTGGRISETITAEWSDVDFAGGYLLVRAEKRKGSRADKLSKLTPYTVAILRQMLLPERRLIWPLPRGVWWLYRAEKQILKAAGLPTDGREFSFHTMRKSVASHVKAAGGDAQQALGHYDKRMTDQVYIDPRVAGQQFASDFLFQPGSFFSAPDKPVTDGPPSAPRLHQPDDDQEQEGRHAG